MMTHRQIIIHSLFLGLCAAFLSSLTALTGSIPFTFFATAAIYTFLRRDLSVQKSIVPLTIVSLLLMIIAFGAGTTLSKDQLITVIIAGIILILYAVPFKWALRNSPVLKPISIALCWALITAGIAFDSNLLFLPNDHSVFEIFLQIFFLTFFLSLMYDHRDVIFLHSQERTLPKIFSEKKFYRILWITLVASFVGFILFAKNTHASVAYFISCIYILFLFKKIKMLNYTRMTWLTDAGFIVYALTIIILNFFD
jgi:hypothetical protein